jgi:hypothetical protein
VINVLKILTEYCKDYIEDDYFRMKKEEINELDEDMLWKLSGVFFVDVLAIAVSGGIWFFVCRAIVPTKAYLVELMIYFLLFVRLAVQLFYLVTVVRNWSPFGKEDKSDK